jgi:hypothetical protein
MSIRTVLALKKYNIPIEVEGNIKNILSTIITMKYQNINICFNLKVVLAG